jgi:hypothetical protein
MLTSQELRDSLTLFEIAPGKKASMQTLAHLLTDVETTLFFGKAYKMPADRLSKLLYHLFRTPLLSAIQEGGHSEELQDYIVDIVPNILEMVPNAFVQAPPRAELTDALWESIDVTIAKSIQDVADNLGDVLDSLPGKQGQMVFRTLHTMNKRRPTIGDYKAQIQHAPVPNQLVIFDVSGSMSEYTVRAIAPEVVALSWKANATLAIVSDTCRVWDPGTFTVDDVLREAEYMGTHYETLTPLMKRDWGTVITIADYDSSQDAKSHLRDNAFGKIGQVLDLSLVNRPTYLAECVGQFADKVTPLLVGSSSYVLG